MVKINKALGAVLAFLFVIQAGLPSFGLEPPLANVAAVGVSAVIAGLSYWLKDV